MNSDLRLHVGFFSNHKIRTLNRRLGDAAVLSWLRLLVWVVQFRPSGVLKGLLDAEAVAIVADWNGDADQFLQTLSELRLIDRSDDDQLSIHDWTEHQEWQSGALGRSRHARRLNHKRWYVDRKIACANVECDDCKPFRISSDSVAIPALTPSDSEQDSTLRYVSVRNQGSLPSGEKRARKKKLSVDEWSPDAALITELSERYPGVNVSDELESLRDWARSKDERRADWGGTLRNWIRKEAKAASKFARKDYVPEKVGRPDVPEEDRELYSIYSAVHPWVEDHAPTREEFTAYWMPIGITLERYEEAARKFGRKP